MSTRLSDYDYPLPEELIAKRPLPRRDESRMMVLHRESQTIEHRQFCELKSFLSEESFLQNLFCIFLVAGHAISHVVDAARMALHQQTKSLLVAGQHLRHNGCIADLHSIRLDRNNGKRLGRYAIDQPGRCAESAVIETFNLLASAW